MSRAIDASPPTGRLSRFWGTQKEMRDVETHDRESRWDIVSATATALARGGASLQNVPGLIKRLIQEETWREYVTPVGRVETFPTFAAFIVHPWGLNTTIDLLERICGEDMAALDAIEQATTRKRGGQSKAERAIDVCNTNIQEQRKRRTSNDRAYALRRLRKERPDIHARVLAGDLSPHRGMIAAGFLRQPTPLDALHRAWTRASPDERRLFLAAITRAADGQEAREP